MRSKRKFFILVLILFFCAVKGKTSRAESVAESSKEPPVQYMSTVDAFETKKIGTPTSLYIDEYDEMYILGDGAKTLFVFSELYQPGATISQGQGHARNSVLLGRTGSNGVDIYHLPADQHGNLIENP